MTALDALRSIKSFIEREVASKIELQKELSDPPEYVNPYVSIITLPHKNFMPVNFQVPHILIGVENGTDDTEEHILRVRISCATYGGDVDFQEQNNIPDEKGYIDLLTLLERIKLKLIDATIIEESCVVERPVTYGIYDEQLTYPYWYGYLQFEVQIPIVQAKLSKDIREKYL